MKKLLIASLTALALTTSAQAGNPWPVIGGIAGGLLLGEILSQNHHQHEPRVYVEPSPYYDEQMCWYEYRKVWDHHLQRYFVEKIRVCD